MVARDDLRDAASRLGLSARALRGLDSFAIETTRAASPEAQALIDLGLELHDAVGLEDARLRKPEAHRSVSRLLADRMIGLLGVSDVLTLRPASDGRAAARHVRRAMEHMRANYGEIVTVSDVAEACGASIRTLEAAFRALRAQTPFQALTEIRLDAVRRALIATEPPASVTDAALRCGFGHLGRFSVIYRARFDEGPSETLRRTRIGAVRSKESANPARSFERDRTVPQAPIESRRLFAG